MEFSTKAIHVGQEADKTTGATTVPIYQTSTYTQLELGEHRGYEYSRTGNPTRTAFEQCLASLENAKFGLAFATGTAATSTVMNLLSSGDHVVAAEDLYGGTFRLFDKVYTRYGVKFTFVDTRDPKNVQNAITPETKLIWLETPTNPLLQLADLEAISEIACSRNIKVAVDNTFASPYFQKPLDLGAAIVAHSTTKYIGGHSDLVGGALAINDENIYEKLKFHQNAVGGTPGPFDTWLALRGLKTLALRMERHDKNANAIAHFLVEQPSVENVYYPGLKSHPQHALALKQMTGFSGMVSFTVKGGLESARKVLNRTKLFSLAESLGGVESLIGHPATMTHASFPEAERERRGVTNNLIRLSVGIEGVNDLIDDLKEALG